MKYMLPNLAKQINAFHFHVFVANRRDKLHEFCGKFAWAINSQSCVKAQCHTIQHMICKTRQAQKNRLIENSGHVFFHFFFFAEFHTKCSMPGFDLQLIICFHSVTRYLIIITCSRFALFQIANRRNRNVSQTCEEVEL